MKIRYSVFTIILLLVTNNVLPQYSGDSVKCWMCKNNIHAFHTPYTFGWKHEIPYIAASLGVMTTGIILDKTNGTEPYNPQQLADLNRDDVNPFDRGVTYNWSGEASNVSDVFLIGSVVSPLLFLTNKPTRSDFGWLALMSWEVLSVNYGITTTVKNLTDRPRPYVYNPDAPIEERTGTDSRESFFSGHVSTTAAMSVFIASVLDEYHPEMKTGIRVSMWTIAALYPAFTGFLRIKAGKHYRTDVIAAYAAGSLTGWLIPFLHKKRKINDKFSFAPVNIRGNAGLYMSFKF